MNKPTDYPVPADQSDSVDDSRAADITYAMLRDRVEAKQPVTDEMIRIARTQLDTAHVKPTAVKSTTATGKFTLNRLRDRFK